MTHPTADFLVLYQDLLGPTFDHRRPGEKMRDAIARHIPDLTSRASGRLRLWHSTSMDDLPINGLAINIISRLGYPHLHGWSGTVAITMEQDGNSDFAPLSNAVRAAMEEALTDVSLHYQARLPQDAIRAELGSGVLLWSKHERRTTRYGSVSLWTSAGFEREAIPFPNAPVGQHGILVVTVLETRQSDHIGDLDLGITPRTPAVGEEIVLGDGVLFIDTNPDTGVPSIGLHPSDGRDTEWLNPRALYAVHSQTVRLELRKTGENA